MEWFLKKDAEYKIKKEGVKESRKKEKTEITKR